MIKQTAKEKAIFLSRKYEDAEWYVNVLIDASNNPYYWMAVKSELT